MYKDIIFKLGEFTLESMIYEVSCFPSFGLVSPISNGSHKDMNFYTFISSASTINRYFIEMAKAGYSEDSYDLIFSKIRKIGLEAEAAMLKKTIGINTHKGMIFVLGLGVAATANNLYHKGKFTDISEVIKKMTKGVVERELLSLKTKELKKLTHGEKIFLEYNITGVRGEAESGFSIVFDYALALYKNIDYPDENSKILNTLLGIMSRCEDTTILHRHDYQTLLEVQKRAKCIMELGGVNNKNIDTEIKEFDCYNENNNISPGGCADLLALTIFLSKVKDEFYQN